MADQKEKKKKHLFLPNNCANPDGRPKKELDWGLFERLCFVQCTHDEIASIMDISKDLLYLKAIVNYQIPDFSTIYTKFSAGGKASLRRQQFKLAEKNAAMGIWLGKNYLKQTEPKDETGVAEQTMQQFNALMKMFEMMQNQNSQASETQKTSSTENASETETERTDST